MPRFPGAGPAGAAAAPAAGGSAPPPPSTGGGGAGGPSAASSAESPPAAAEAGAARGQAQDLLVVVHQRVEQFLAEYSGYYSRLLRLEHLQYHALIAEGLSVAGVGMKQSDGVANETVDVTNRASTECLFACSAQSGNQGIRFSESMIALTWALMSFFCELLCIG